MKSKQAKRYMRSYTAYRRLAAKAFHAGDMRAWERHLDTAEKYARRAARADQGPLGA